MSKRKKKIPNIEVVDLFCGIGGLSFGMKSKGFQIKAGYDLDGSCKYAYEVNNSAVFHYQDIKSVNAEDINANYPKAKSFFSIISEFATYVLNPELFVHKLFEVGTPFMKNNAFKKSFTHFITNMNKNLL